MHNHLAFAVVRKKTPYQKHREKEEEKKKRADEEAARLYEEFVESFKAEEDKSGPKSFVRGGTILPGTNDAPKEVAESMSDGSPPRSGIAFPSGQTSNTGTSTTRGKGQYVPSFIPPSMAAAMKADEQAKQAGKSIPRKEESVFTMPGRKSDKSKPKNIDLVLETLKRDQELREERFKHRRDGRSSGFDVTPERFPSAGSFADGDPYTTNLYVGNLAPDVDEEIMKREFGRFGPIASVKIMWPRDEEQRRRGSNCGFVAFMKREDAQQAQEKLNGEMLHDYELRIGWGKSVPIPPVPVYPPPSAESLKQLQLPGIHPIVQQNLPKAKDRSESAEGHNDIEVVLPEDNHVRYIIDTLAAYVLRDGCSFEQLVMEREGRNPLFKFLFDLNSNEHAYYRWRLFSLAQGDGMKSWRIEPFVMIQGGPKWIPPNMCVGDGSQLTAAQKGGDVRDRHKCLSDLERDRFEDMLRSLKVEKQGVCDAMVFALDNAESAQEIVGILVESLTIAETPVALKVARLFLVSDILHNSTAPVRNASQYRSKLEEKLPEVFESFQETYVSLDNKLTQEAVRRHILRILRIWRNWFIFSNDYLNGLQATFLRGPNPPPANTDLLSELEELQDESLERKCRQNGLSRTGTRSELIARLIALDAYLHGESKTDAKEGGTQKGGDKSGQADVQGGGQMTGGENGGEVSRRKASQWTTVDAEEEKKTQPIGPVSKWLLEEQQQGGQTSGSSEKIFSDAGSTPVIQAGLANAHDDSDGEDTRMEEASSGPPKKDRDGVGGAARMDPEEIKRRQAMRQVEVTVMEYRVELEEQGLGKEAIEAKVGQYRAKLLGEAGQKHGSDRSHGDRRSKEEGREEGGRARSRNNSGGSRERSSQSGGGGGGGGDQYRVRDRDRDDAGKGGDRREQRRGGSRSKGKERDSDGKSSHSGRQEGQRSKSRSRSLSRSNAARRGYKERSRSRSRSPSYRKRKGGSSHRRH